MSDLIRREDAINALAKHEKSQGHNYSMFQSVVSECAEIIRDLPSAEPEITLEDVKKYCEKRGLVILTSDFYNEMKSRWSSIQPEVIQCKDCVYFTHEKSGEHWSICRFYDAPKTADGFCNDAERKEE